MAWVVRPNCRVVLMRDGVRRVHRPGTKLEDLTQDEEKYLKDFGYLLNDETGEESAPVRTAEPSKEIAGVGAGGSAGGTPVALTEKEQTEQEKKAPEKLPPSDQPAAPATPPQQQGQSAQQQQKK